VIDVKRFFCFRQFVLKVKTFLAVKMPYIRHSYISNAFIILIPLILFVKVRNIICPILPSQAQSFTVLRVLTDFYRETGNCGDDSR